MFKPAGIPARNLEKIVMSLDEFEAIRLADLEGYYQEEAAGRMQVSRPTFSRIVEAARRKVADALMHGKVLQIEGGPVVECPPDKDRKEASGWGRRQRRWREVTP